MKGLHTYRDPARREDLKGARRKKRKWVKVRNRLPNFYRKVLKKGRRK